VVAYLPALPNGWVWDDDDYVTANQALRSLDGLRRLWLEPGVTPQYYPVTFTSFWVEWQLWGDWAPGFHLTNVLLHAANAVLVWRVLVALEVPGAWIAAALFAVHPVHVESVAWVTERKNVLSGAFYLSAALLFLRRGPYAAVVALFVLSLLSKSVTATLPVGLAIALWWRDGRVRAADVWLLAPLVVLGFGSGLMTAAMDARASARWARTGIRRSSSAASSPGVRSGSTRGSSWCRGRSPSTTSAGRSTRATSSNGRGRPRRWRSASERGVRAEGPWRRSRSSR
jgi:hypothetical protein